MKILEIGCGNNKYKSKNKEDRVIGLDRAKLPGVDIVHNLEKVPLPFKDNGFDKIIAFHVLEHIENFILLMHEIWRITKNKGIVWIKVPFYSAWGQFNNPTHVRFFTPFSFNYFEEKGTYTYQVKRNNKINFKIEKVRIHFGIGQSKILNKIIDPILNLNHRFYCRFFAWIFPAAEIEFELKVIK